MRAIVIVALQDEALTYLDLSRATLPPSHIPVCKLKPSDQERLSNSPAPDSQTAWLNFQTRVVFCYLLQHTHADTVTACQYPPLLDSSYQQGQHCLSIGALQRHSPSGTLLSLPSCLQLLHEAGHFDGCREKYGRLASSVANAEWLVISLFREHCHSKESPLRNLMRIHALWYQYRYTDS